MLIVLAVLVLGLRWPQWRAAISTNRLGLAASASMSSPVARQVANGVISETAASDLAFWAAMASTSNPQDAIVLLLRATKTSAVRPVWWVQLANLYLQIGDTDHAVRALSQIADYDRVIFAHCRSAVFVEAKRQEAVYWCPLLKHLKQEESESVCLLGEYYAQVGQQGDAQVAFERAIDSPTVSDDCLYHFGLHQFSQQHHREALGLFERAFSQNHLPLYLRTMGDVYAAINQPDLALRKYQQVLGMVSSGRDYADALSGMGKIQYYYYHDYQKASALMYKATQCDVPVDVSVYWTLMLSERALGRSEQAIQACDAVVKALSGGSYLLEWRYKCANYLLELGRTAEAQEVYQGILRDVPDDSVAKDALTK